MFNDKSLLNLSCLQIKSFVIIIKVIYVSSSIDYKIFYTYKYLCFYEIILLYLLLLFQNQDCFEF